MKRIPIKIAKHIAKTYGYDQVIVIARDLGGKDGKGGEHCTTYGRDKLHCSVAARIGDFLKQTVMQWGSGKAPPPDADDNPLKFVLDAADDRSISDVALGRMLRAQKTAIRLNEAELDDHSELMSKLPRVRPEFLEELRGSSRWALRRRVLIQADWIRAYSESLDGLGLKHGVEKCRDPRDIRRIVEGMQKKLGENKP